MGGSEDGSDTAKSQIAGLMASSHIPYILNRLNISISSSTADNGEWRGGGFDYTYVQSWHNLFYTSQIYFGDIPNQGDYSGP